MRFSWIYWMDESTIDFLIKNNIYKDDAREYMRLEQKAINGSKKARKQLDLLIKRCNEKKIDMRN